MRRPGVRSSLIVAVSVALVTTAALGSRFNTKILSATYLEPGSGRLLASTLAIDQGQAQVSIDIRVEAGQAIVDSTLGAGSKAVPLGPDTLVETPFFTHVVGAFADGATTTRSWEILDPRDAEVHRVTYTTSGVETVAVPGGCCTAPTPRWSSESRSPTWIRP